MKSQFVIIACDISRSAFSGERVFEVPTTAGGLFIGAAPVDYCTARNGMRFGPNDPPRNQKAHGFVAARIVRDGGGRARVAFPDGEGAEISADLVRERLRND